MSCGALALIVLLTCAVQLSFAARCDPVKCRVSYRYKYTTKCGFWNLSRCTKYSTRYRTQTCNYKCPDCTWTAWGSKLSCGSCSVSCGIGSHSCSQTRTRIQSTITSSSSNGSRTCDGSATRYIPKACSKPCPKDCEWSSWSSPAWGTCPVTCGGGMLTRTLTRTKRILASNGGKDCTGISKKTESKECNTLNCPVDCKWSEWSYGEWVSCSATCGGGTKTRNATRTIETEAAYGGLECTGNATKFENSICNSEYCPVDCKWSEWSYGEWGSCSATCGGGTKTRSATRTIETEAAYGGLECTGNETKMENSICNSEYCPVDCKWSDWSYGEWGSCSATCGGGTKTRNATRTIETEAAYGGLECTGTATKIENSICNSEYCPVDCKWSEWSYGEWGSCSATCGGGTKTRSAARTIETEAAYGGSECTGNATKIENSICNSEYCPVDCKWSEWSIGEWGSCPATCGGGTMTRTLERTIETVATHGGLECTGNPTEIQISSCNIQYCPVDCKWSEWSYDEWGSCSGTCGGGTKTRNAARTIETEAAYGGLECTGNATKIEKSSCHIQNCPVDGGWSEWTLFSKWSSCNSTCMTTRSQYRQCKNPPPAFGGQRCKGANRNYETVDCFEGDCLDSACHNQSYNRAALPRNCGQFVMCLNYGNVVLGCAPGTHWNQQQLACVHAASSGCKDSDEADDDDGELESESEKCIWPQYTIAGKGCESCQNNYAETSGCVTSYVLCVAGMGYRTPCPPGTIYDQTAGVCNHGNC